MMWHIRSRTLSFSHPPPSPLPRHGERESPPQSATDPPRSLAEVRGRTLLMGILNVTPDSFSDGGEFRDPDRAVERAFRIQEEGADLLDLGAESTRPGACPVSEDEELQRLLPVLRRLRPKISIPISIDTTKPDVARICLEEGAEIINDVSGLKDSGPRMAALVRESKAGLILMHRRGNPETMQSLSVYQDVVAEVLKELRESLQLAQEAGIDHEQVVVDPGLGFAKTAEQNLEILRDLDRFHELGFPLLVGPSRKSFIGRITDREVGDREFGTAAAAAICVLKGVQILRVHEIGAMRDAVHMAEAIVKKHQSIR